MKNGLKPDPDKVTSIQNMTEPTTVKQVRAYIGCLAYYRRFIPEFSETAEPLINLTRKNQPFHWNIKCQNAFQQLKQDLIKLPYLANPDLSKPSVLYIFASDECIGACLAQFTPSPIPAETQEVERPIYLLSHKLSRTQCRYSTIEKEAFAINHSLLKLNHYLYNTEFKIKTDHQPLKYILDAPMQKKKIQLWALNISAYNCTIEYIPGVKNVVADFLSRLPTKQVQIKEEEEVLDTNDNNYEINVIDSSALKPRSHIDKNMVVDNIPDKTDFQFQDFNMNIEQEKYLTLQELKKT